MQISHDVLASRTNARNTAGRCRISSMPADEAAKSDTPEPFTDPTSTADDTMGHRPHLLKGFANLCDGGIHHKLG
jgi:hypothetical protein